MYVYENVKNLLTNSKKYSTIIFAQVRILF